MLFPTEVPLLQAARKIQKAALISNFVDRESERPALGPNDFRLPETYCITGSENVDPSTRKKTRSRYDVTVIVLVHSLLHFDTDIVSSITSRRREAHEHNEKDALSW